MTILPFIFMQLPSARNKIWLWQLGFAGGLYNGCHPVPLTIHPKAPTLTLDARFPNSDTTRKKNFKAISHKAFTRGIIL